MMRLTINRYFILICLCAVFPFIGSAQYLVRQDFSFWGWFQLEKKVGQKHYVDFQLQTRFNQNSTTFQRNSFYFLYGINITKKLNAEALYQLSTNYTGNQHAFYIGSTYKLSVTSKFSVYARTALQYTRNDFSGFYVQDEPFSEWRNRIRLAYSFNKVYGMNISVEPYLRFNPSTPLFLSRVRFVSQFNVKYNKYNSFNLYYLIEPDWSSRTKPRTDYVLGLTYKINLPDKLKDFKKFFKTKYFKKKNKEKDEEQQEPGRDTYN
jgi:hypothetical protein